MLDMRSVLAVQILVLFVCFVVMLITWRQNRKRYKGLSCWTFMLGLSCVGYALLTLRDIAPDFVSIILANLFIICAFVLFNRGIVLFYGIKSRHLPSILAVLGFILLQAYFTYVQPDIHARILVISFSFILIYGHGLWMLLFRIESKHRIVSKYMIWSTAVVIALNAYRIVIHLFFCEGQASLLDQNLPDNIFLILQVPAFLFLIFNMVILVSNFLMLDIKQEEVKFNTIFHAAPYAAIITNAEDSKVIEANDEVLKLLEYSRNELIGNTLLNLDVWVDTSQRKALLDKLKTTGGISGQEINFRSKSGKIVPVLFSASIMKFQEKHHIVSTMKDISEIYRLKSELEELASHDMLTGLPNRRKFDEITAIQLARASRSGERLAMVIFDIDDFKRINDEYGHDVGDKVLVAIADRLREFSRSADNIARHGGDEFTILLNGLANRVEAEAALIRLYKLYEAPIIVDGHSFAVGLSMGVAMYPENGISAYELLGKADKALYVAKRKGKNSVRFASEEE
jgi:diguanylate cyclase (GGDEF)-like protein/PAS domain S-box-containing protein